MLKKTMAIMITAVMIAALAACTSSVSGTESTTGTAASSTASAESTSAVSTGSSSSDPQTDTETAEYSAVSTEVTNAGDMFSDRDLEQTADTSDAETITVTDGQTISITEEGVYVITGTATDCTISVEAESEAKVQLVLDGVSITNSSSPAIYVVSADKCFITTSSDSSLSVTGAFTSDGDTNTDAVIYSKDDVVLNGTAKLTITSSQGSGISGKDDVKLTGGTYEITSALDAIEANELIAVAGADITINSSKDGLHSEYSDDDTTGAVYIYSGTLNITAAADAIQATTTVQINGGIINITASEGIEATYVVINDGTISISASDDGINASAKSSAYSTPAIEINGGSLTIVMGQGDTDAIDANGNVTVTGGTIDITAQMSSFDYDGTATYTGGTIIINGTQVDSIPQPTMGGGMDGGMGGH